MPIGKVSLVLDGGTAVEVFTIEGDGSYVDQGIYATIISHTIIGSKIVDGGRKPQRTHST